MLEEHGSERGEDLSELGAEERLGCERGDDVEEVDNGSRRVGADVAALYSLGKEGEKGGEVTGRCRLGVLFLQRCVDRIKDYRRLPTALAIVPRRRMSESVRGEKALLSSGSGDPETGSCPASRQELESTWCLSYSNPSGVTVGDDGSRCRLDSRLCKHFRSQKNPYRTTPPPIRVRFNI